jgi:hypothetical protein
MPESIDATQAPEWFEGLRWIVVAILVAIATVGPHLFSNFLAKQRSKQGLAAPQTPENKASAQMAVVGGALADRDAVLELARVIDRLCDITEARYRIELEENEEDKMRRTIRELMDELGRKDRS